MSTAFPMHDIFMRRCRSLKNQRDANQAVRDLYSEMISVYEEASKKDILQQRDGLHGTYSSLFKQTIECAMFIEGYAKKSGIGRYLLNQNIL